MRIFTAPLLALLLATPAAAQPVQSAYTDVDLDQCSIVQADDFGATFACPGYKGIPVMIAEGDLRFFVSYGLNSTAERAAEQTLPPFNRLGPKIEWLLAMRDGRLQPFATILRFFTQRESGEPEGQVLVVTRLEPGATCHVAYVDARANADANQMARDAAEELAADLDCANQPDIIGAFEAW
jgi:hypothetical protein